MQTSEIIKNLTEQEVICHCKSIYSREREPCNIDTVIQVTQIVVCGKVS